MDAVGTDANKIYDDVLVTGYDADSKPIMDSSKKSFSSTFFPCTKRKQVSCQMDRPITQQ